MIVDYVDIPSKTVEFEDGRVTTVLPFRVSKSCVTVGELLDFQRATGYLTLAERDRHGKPFYLNELVEHIPEQDRAGAVAFCLSFLDAVRYCEWAGMRLPSEAEWLAAAIIDERIYDPEVRANYPRPQPSGGCGAASLEGGQCEFTSTQTEGGLFVVRAGPWYFRDVDWREYVDSHRRLVLPDEWDLFHCFRVIPCRVWSK